MRKEDCLFCKIVAGEIPSAKVYEDDRVLAFEDVNPQMPVHTLIVPKNHYDNIADGIPDAQQSVHRIHVHVRGGAPMNSGDPSAK